MPSVRLPDTSLVHAAALARTLSGDELQVNAWEDDIGTILSLEGTKKSALAKALAKLDEGPVLKGGLIFGLDKIDRNEMHELSLQNIKGDQKTRSLRIGSDAPVDHELQNFMEADKTSLLEAVQSIQETWIHL